MTHKNELIDINTDTHKCAKYLIIILQPQVKKQQIKIKTIGNKMTSRVDNSKNYKNNIENITEKKLKFIKCTHKEVPIANN